MADRKMNLAVAITIEVAVDADEGVTIEDIQIAWADQMAAGNMFGGAEGFDVTSWEFAQSIDIEVGDSR